MRWPYQEFVLIIYYVYVHNVLREFQIRHIYCLLFVFYNGLNVKIAELRNTLVKHVDSLLIKLAKFKYSICDFDNC